MFGIYNSNKRKIHVTQCPLWWETFCNFYSGHRRTFLIHNRWVTRGPLCLFPNSLVEAEAFSFYLDKRSSGERWNGHLASCYSRFRQTNKQSSSSRRHSHRYHHHRRQRYPQIFHIVRGEILPGKFCILFNLRMEQRTTIILMPKIAVGIIALREKLYKFTR